MGEQANKGQHPSIAAICEQQAAKALAEAIREWRKAGKPHKR